MNPTSRLFGDFDEFARFGDFPSILTGVRQPRVDVRDTGTNIEVDVELPGVAKDAVDLSVTDNQLEIRATVAEEAASEGENFYIREIGQRSFYRTIPLPAEADPEDVEAELEDGCLCITFGKRADTEGRRRSIKVR